MQIPTSDRLTFRTWSPDDLDHALSLWGDPEVMAFIGKGGLSREQVLARLQNEIACQEKHGLQYWPLFKKDGGAFVGCCGLKPWVHTQHGGYELGFHIARAAWGQGFALEAARAVIALAKERALSPIMAGHHPDNLNSRKILLKLGFAPIESALYPPTGLRHPCYTLAPR